MRRRIFGFGALALLLAFPLPAAAPDWTRTVNVSPERGYVLGNPDAPVRLVEYLSYTCSHCAAFSAEASQTLKRGYVAGGKVSIEIRHALRDRFDLVAALLARCDGPAKFFGHSEAILAAQSVWMAQAQRYGESEAAQTQKPSGAELLFATAQGSGLAGLMIKRGMTVARVKRCLADPAQQAAVTAMADGAWNKLKIAGTPSFLLNGTLLTRTASWAALRPQLDQALN